MAPDIVAESVGYAQVSASGNISPKSAALVGIFVSAASATPTITVYDDAGTGTSTKIVDTFTPVAGTYYKLPFRALNGLNVVIGGTVSCTVGYQTETLK
jgi:hypothetical protein